MEVSIVPVLLSLALIMCCILEAWSKDYYEVLGISKNARDKEISKAFRRLARKYHPDRNRDDPTTEEKFIEISKAYEVLSDPAARQRYDSYGDAGHPGSTANHEGFQFSKRNTKLRDFTVDLDNLFREFDRQFKNSNDRSNEFRQGLDDEPFFQHSTSFRPGRTRGREMNVEDAFQHFGAGGPVRGTQEHWSSSKTQRCHTITRRVGGAVTTETTCVD